MSDLFDRAAMATIGSPSAFRARRRTRFEPLPEVADAIAPTLLSEERTDGIVEVARPVASGLGTAVADAPELSEQSRAVAGGALGRIVAPNVDLAGALGPEPWSVPSDDRADDRKPDPVDMRGEHLDSAARATIAPPSSRELASAQTDVGVTPTSRQHKPHPDGITRLDRDPAPAPIAPTATATRIAPAAMRRTADDRAMDRPPSASAVHVAVGDGQTSAPLPVQAEGHEGVRVPPDPAGEPQVAAIAPAGEGLLAAPVRSADPFAWPGDRADRQHPAPVAPVRQPRQTASPAAAPPPATVEVTIGRLEIRAAAPAMPGQRPKRAFAPHLDLEAYRARRDRRE